MNEPLPPRRTVDAARSFDLVADAYDRSRPSYPPEAVTWLLDDLTGPDAPARVVELGAGTGLLTEQLVAAGCRVTAVDVSEGMLARLAHRAPQAHRVAGLAERVPVAGRGADLVVAAQSFHWFDPDRTLQEAARVLRPGGRLAAVWNRRDDRIPWVKRLGRIVGASSVTRCPADLFDHAVDESGIFQTVERATFRFWQPMSLELLRDLVRSRPPVTLAPDSERDRVLAEVQELYEEYGRGSDGMLLPYVTTACRATVLPWGASTSESSVGAAAQQPAPSNDALVDHSVLIDFR